MSTENNQGRFLDFLDLKVDKLWDVFLDTMFTYTNKYIKESEFLIFFYNKTEYFRLRLSYKVSSELRETWDRHERDLSQNYKDWEL